MWRVYVEDNEKDEKDRPVCWSRRVIAVSVGRPVAFLSTTRRPAPMEKRTKIKITHISFIYGTFSLSENDRDAKNLEKKNSSTK